VKVGIFMAFIIYRMWSVVGGQYGLTCNKTGNASDSDTTLYCKKLVIPNCVDRTVYCTYPPDPYPQGIVTVKSNPSTVYKKAPGKIESFM